MPAFSEIPTACSSSPPLAFNPSARRDSRIDLQLYRWVLIAHGAWRWAVLVAGFAAVLSAAVRLEQRKPWAPVGPRLGKTFGIAVDIQTLMGASLYLILSPLTTIGVRSTTAPL